MSRFYFGEKSTDDIAEFVDYYKQSYYLDGPKIKGINRGNQSSIFVEGEIDKLLERGIATPNDVWNILAWKIGGIDHPASEKEQRIVLKKGWTGDVIQATQFQKLEKSNLDKIAEYISQNINQLGQSTPNDIRDALIKEIDDALTGIGSTYMVTLIYFILRGGFPIFDVFASAAVKAILNEDRIPEERSSSYLNSSWTIAQMDKADRHLFEEGGVLFNYNKNIDSLENEIIKRLGDAYIRRDLDRALWVYGHLFYKK